ncbi:hypothetical protein C8R45DRAFT_1023735 [Mycena sanguinolenta]|nr:hypothetical protein C8R45DRAFT_1023735 [Mycena sanguinolenta]
MAFEALGEDVLLRILSFCDISTVLAVSAVNKPLRRIALAKQLWLSLVLDATFRDALDLPPPDREKLECLSTEELIDVVKNAVAGPGSVWNENEQTTFEVTLDDILLDMGFGFPETHLLPGARYILIHSTTQLRLYIYDVWSSRRVWHSPVQAQTLWRVDLVPGGAIARVFDAQLAVIPDRNTLHVDEIDLATGASHELFNFSFASTVFRIMPSAIVGDFLLCTVMHSYSHFNVPTLVLVDWRASTFASLGSVDPYANVQLIRGYILSRYRESEPPHHHLLAVTALEAFSAHWQRLTEDNLAFRLDGSAPALPITIGATTTQERLECSGRPFEPHIVIATPDAMHTGGYIIFVHGVHRARYCCRTNSHRDRDKPAATCEWFPHSVLPTCCKANALE